MTVRLSTTSYAVLAMLALRPWTPYELTQQMRRSLGHCWPISERAIYSEPERLVEAGLAERDTTHGAAGRRTYSITDAGREAMSAWMSTEPDPPRFFNEALLRLLFADLGTPEDLIQSLRAMREELATRHAEGWAVMRQYADEAGPFPQRAHLIALMGNLIARVDAVYEEWAGETLAHVETWDTTRDLGLTDHARELIERTTQAFPPFRS